MFTKPICNLILMLASFQTASLGPARAEAGQGRFEVVGRTRSSDPTLLTWVVTTTPSGSEMVVMAFRRDEFLVAVDLATGECRQHFLSPGMPWSLASGNDGRVYVGTSLSPGALFLRYDPTTDKVDPIAKAEGEQILYWMESDAKGMIYVGSYPGAQLYRYSPISGEFKSLGRMDQHQTYNLSGAVARDGKVYSGLGMKEQTVIEFDPATGGRKNIWPEEWKMPSGPKVYRGSDGLVYAASGNPNAASKGRALRISPGGKVEQIASAATAPYDRGHAAFSESGRPILRDGSIIVDVTRERIVLEAWRGRGRARTIELKFAPLVKDIFSIGLGPGGKIYGTSKPAVMFSYDPATREMSDLVKASPKVGQIYRYVQSDGKLYMGSYGHAEFHVYDPAKPGQKTRTIGRAGAYQDRPVDMTVDSQGLIYAACYPGYGERGGALTYFDPATEKFQNFRNIIPQESLSALALDEARQRMFVGSSEIGGSGAEASGRDATVAVWDMSKRQVTGQVVPVPGERIISGLVFAPTGWVCGVTSGGRWFGLDADTLTVRFANQLPGRPPSLTRLVYDAKRRVIYGMAGKILWRARIENPSVIEPLGAFVSKETNISYGVEMDGLGAIYFAAGKELVKWVP